MNAFARNCLKRSVRIFQTFMVFPLALVLMLIPLEVALAAHVFSLWLRNENWKTLGAGLDVFAVVLVLAVAIATVRFFIVWIGHLLRTIRSLETKPPETNS